jgi:hypothetical protein
VQHLCGSVHMTPAWDSESTDCRRPQSTAERSGTDPTLERDRSTSPLHAKQRHVPLHSNCVLTCCVVCVLVVVASFVVERHGAAQRRGDDGHSQ